MPDFDRLAGQVVESARGFVARAVAGLDKRIDDLSVRQTTLETLGGGLGDTIDRMVKAAIVAIPVAKDGAPGTSAFQIACLGGFSGTEAEWLTSLRGKDAPAVDVAAIAADIAAKIPAPLPGKDADPELLRTQVAEHFAALADDFAKGLADGND